jgi:hypothetical protein
LAQHSPGLGQAADGESAATQPGQRVSLVPGTGDGARYFQGPLMTLLGPVKPTADAIQCPPAVECLRLTCGNAEVAVDTQGLLQGLLRGRVVAC